MSASFKTLEETELFVVEGGFVPLAVVVGPMIVVGTFYVLSKRSKGKK